MNRKKRLTAAGFAALMILISTVFVVAWGQQAGPTATQSRSPAAPERLIDDFSGKDQLSVLGTKWALRTDQTSGGAVARASRPRAEEKAQGQDALATKLEFVQQDGQACLHLTGSVTSADRGGFIAAQLALHPRGRNFDAHGFVGLRLRVKGNGESYAIRLRTKDTRFATQYYEAALQTNGQWQEVKLPFIRFVPVLVQSRAGPAGLQPSPSSRRRTSSRCFGRQPVPLRADHVQRTDARARHSHLGPSGPSPAGTTTSSKTASTPASDAGPSCSESASSSARMRLPSTIRFPAGQVAERRRRMRTRSSAWLRRAWGTSSRASN